MAKRVKWETWRRHMVFANLAVDALVIDELPDAYFVRLCFCKHRKFSSLKAAQRYCIREAKKLHKLVGTQLDQLAKEVE